MLVCLNGTFIPHEIAQLPVNDGSLLFGDSLFETIKAENHKILLQDEHLDRLELSAKLLNFPCQRQRIETSLQQLARALNTPTSRIRLTIGRGQHQGLDFPGKEEGWFLLTAKPYTEISGADREAGAACVVTPNKRVNPLDHLPQMKRGNYADCLYATNYAHSKGAREALFADAAGYLLEGSTCNLFAFSAGRLVTPPLGQTVLAGIMRRQIVDAATELGYLVVERNLHKSELIGAEEAFICNSLIDILPISSIDGIPLQRGPKWKMLLKTLQTRIGT